MGERIYPFRPWHVHGESFLENRSVKTQLPGCELFWVMTQWWASLHRTRFQSPHAAGQEVQKPACFHKFPRDDPKPCSNLPYTRGPSHATFALWCELWLEGQGHGVEAGNPSKAHSECAPQGNQIIRMFAGWWLVTQGALKSRASILAFDIHLACFRFPLRTGGGSLPPHGESTSVTCWVTSIHFPQESGSVSLLL